MTEDADRKMDALIRGRPVDDDSQPERYTGPTSVEDMFPWETLDDLMDAEIRRAAGRKA